MVNINMCLVGMRIRPGRTQRQSKQQENQMLPSRTRCTSMSLLYCRWALMALLLFLLSASTTAMSLKSVAEKKGVYFGNLLSSAFLQNPRATDGGRYSAVLTRQFNVVVLENDMKMNAILPPTEPAGLFGRTPRQLSKVLNSANIRKFLRYAKNPRRGMRTRGHVMIWFNQVPQWLNDKGPTWSAQEVFEFSQKYILALGILSGNDIDEWDVINEAINQDTAGWREGTWYRNANNGAVTRFGKATYENYIRHLFVWARRAQPKARLYYNDFSIEFFSEGQDSKNKFMRSKFIALKKRGTPIDGIGFQSHFILEGMVRNGKLNQGFFDSIQRSMEALDRAGLEVALTELDIRRCGAGTAMEQKMAYKALVKMAMSQPNCREVLIWGMNDRTSWIPLFFPCDFATLYTGNYTKKQAWFGVRDALKSLPAASFPPAFPPLS